MFGSSQMFGATQSGAVENQASGEKKRGRDDKQSCLPVTIRSIEEALLQQAESSGEIQFYGRDQGMLVLVACAEKVQNTGATLEASLNDASGRIKARHYITDDTRKWADLVTPGSYVSVIGNVRTSPEVHFAIQMLKPVKSADDVSFHAIEVAHAALKLLKGKGSSRVEPITPSKPVAASNPTSATWEISPPKLPEPKASAMETMSTTTAPVATPARAPLKGAELKQAIVDFVRKEGEGKAAGAAMAAIRKEFTSVRDEALLASIHSCMEDGDVYDALGDNKYFQVV
jgi:hypothetical protein